MREQYTTAERLKVLSQISKGYSQRQVAQKLHLHRSFVQRCCAALDKGDIVEVPKRSGPPTVLTESAKRRAVELLAGPQHLTSTQAAQRLHAEQLTPRIFYRTTVAKGAIAQAKMDGNPIHVLRDLPNKALTPGTVEKRLTFAKAHKNSSFRPVMVTDRKRFVHLYPGTCVVDSHWAFDGEVEAAFKPNHPSSVNVYAGITEFGTTDLVVVSGTTGFQSPYTNKAGQQSRNIGIAEYKNVLLEGLLPDGDRIFKGQGISTWLLQQDNDPCHKVGSMQALEQFNQHGRHHVQLLQGWPPNSPDLSPIENLWGIVQSRVNRRGCETFQQFKAAVFEEWHNVDLPLLQALMGSMHSRMQQCIAANGGKINY